MPYREFREFPEVHKNIVDTCLRPYQLSEPVMEAVMVVCRHIYDSAFLEGSNAGHKEAHDSYLRSLKVITEQIALLCEETKKIQI